MVTKKPNRVRVKLDFELDIKEEGFPDWLLLISRLGVQAAVDSKRAKSPVQYHGGGKCNLSVVSDAELKRRETRLKRKVGG